MLFRSAIPYHSGLPTIDMLGLTDAHVARRRPDLRYRYPGHQRHDGPYVLSRSPDLILLANGPVVGRPGPFPWEEVRVYEQDLVLDPRFRRQYRLIHVPLSDGALLQLFVRSGPAR